MFFVYYYFRETFFRFTTLSALDDNNEAAAVPQQAPQFLVNEDESNEGEPSPATVGRPNSLASFIESSRELSPRLAKEYKEAFGGLQSESGGALARFKRIKRIVLGDPDETKISRLPDETLGGKKW